MSEQPKDLYTSLVTYSNMEEMLTELKKKQEIEELCEVNSLNISLLKKFFHFSMKGFNNAEIAQKIGCHRITIQRYTATLKKMKELEFQKIYMYILNEEKNAKKDTYLY